MDYGEFTDEEVQAAVEAIIAERDTLRAQVAALQAEIKTLREQASRGAGAEVVVDELTGLMFGEGWEEE